MRNIKLTIEYDGKEYIKWIKLKKVEKILKKLFTIRRIRSTI